MRSGFVAVLGRPNVGKTSLVNRIVGEQLSAVSRKPQTTWHQVRGIRTDERGQIIFVDTPGLHKALSRMNQAMVLGALDAVADADCALVVVDASDVTAVDREVVELVAARVPTVVALNKIDRVAPEDVHLRSMELSEWGEIDVAATSALEGSYVEELVSRLLSKLPEGPMLYPDEELTDRPVRFLVTEYVRQAIFENLAQEVPYSAFVEIEEFDEARDPIYIKAIIYLERESQKRILIGQGGKQIREIGTRARALTEGLLGQQIFLDLWVKVLHKWTKREQHLRRAGLLVTPQRRHQSRELAERWHGRDDEEGGP